MFNAWNTVARSSRRIFLSSFNLAVCAIYELLKELETVCSIDALDLRLPGIQITKLRALTASIMEMANSRPQPDRLLDCFEIMVALSITIVDSNLNSILISASEKNLHAISKIIGVLVRAYAQTVHLCKLELPHHLSDVG